MLRKSTMNRRNVRALEHDIKNAQGKRAKAEAYFALGLFHDSQRREAKAIPNYRKAICYGLPRARKAHVFAHLARALWKTGKRRAALGNSRIALRLTRDRERVAHAIHGQDREVGGRSEYAWNRRHDLGILRRIGRRWRWRPDAQPRLDDCAVPQRLSSQRVAAATPTATTHSTSAQLLPTA